MRNFRSTLSVAASLGLFLVLGAPAVQAEPDPACREAARALCGDTGDRESFRQCMRERRDEMPDACRERASERRDRVHSVLDACREEVSALCGDLERGKGRIFRCLRASDPDLLSTECDAALSGLPQRR